MPGSFCSSQNKTATGNLERPVCLPCNYVIGVLFWASQNTEHFVSCMGLLSMLAAAPSSDDGWRLVFDRSWFHSDSCSKEWSVVLFGELPSGKKLRAQLISLMSWRVSCVAYGHRTLSS